MGGFSANTRYYDGFSILDEHLQKSLDIGHIDKILHGCLLEIFRFPIGGYH